jgi:hypothetical protein
MATFKDSKGRDWVLDLDLPAFRRVRSRTGFELGKDSKLGELFDDWVLLGDVLFALVEDQAKSAGIDSEDFGRSLKGDGIENAAAAFIEAYLDFYPSRRAAALRAMLAMTGRIEADAMELVIEASTTSRSTPGNSPASSESIPSPAG